MSNLVCDKDCKNCIYNDCINDDFTLEDYHFSQSLDKEIKREDVPKVVLRHRESALAWYHRNKDSELKRQEKFREENRDVLREKVREYHREHREQENQRHLANYYSNHEENKKKARESKKSRYKENPEYYRQKQREYRQRVKERRMNNESTNEQQTVFA